MTGPIRKQAEQFSGCPQGDVTLAKIIETSILPGSTVYSDGAAMYEWLNKHPASFRQLKVIHAKGEFSKRLPTGELVSTNGVEETQKNKGRWVLGKPGFYFFNLEILLLAPRGCCAHTVAHLQMHRSTGTTLASFCGGCASSVPRMTVGDATLFGIV